MSLLSKVHPISERKQPSPLPANIEKLDDVRQQMEARLKELSVQNAVAVVPEPSEGEVVQCVYGGQDGDALLLQFFGAGRYCYDHSAKLFNVYKSPCWGVDIKEESLRVGISLVIDCYTDLLNKVLARAGTGDQKLSDANLIKRLEQKINKLQTLAYKKNIRELASCGEDGLGISGEEFDTHPYYLAVANGVVDLRTGILMPGRPELYLRSHSSIKYDEKEPAPVEFLAFLYRTFQFTELKPELADIHGIEEGYCSAAIQEHEARLTRWEKNKKTYTRTVVDFMQVLLGYAICGEVREHILPIYFGEGRNGKGVLLEILKYVLGSYAGPVQPEMLLAQKPGSSSNASPEIIGIRAMRLLWGSETNERAQFDASTVKRLVGADTLVGRLLYSNHIIRFEPSHTLILMTNNKPHAPADDYALWQRILLIPFSVRFVENPDPNNPCEGQMDKNLMSKLKKEAPGILKWLIDGHLMYQRDGLQIPDIIKASTQEYRAEVDVIGHFIENACTVSDTQQITGNSLYECYKAWCQANGHKIMSNTRFGEKISKKFKKSRTSSGIFYRGIYSDYCRSIDYSSNRFA